MANFATALKAEVVRLARREIRGQTLALQKASAAHRRQIAALRRQVVALERKAKTLVRNTARAVPAAAADAEESGGSVRFVAKGLKSLRARLGLSAGELGRLLGVSGQSVYNWENQKAVPRRAQVQALAQLRGLGKREARARLEPAEAAPAATRKRGRPAGSAKRAAKPTGKRQTRPARGRAPRTAKAAKRAKRAARSA
jgi:DNA-binding transcriptional regulator YiaG